MVKNAMISSTKDTWFTLTGKDLCDWGSKKLSSSADGPQLVQTLFAMATFLEPAVIFIDDIDMILSKPADDGGSCYMTCIAGCACDTAPSCARQLKAMQCYWICLTHACLT